MSGEPKPLCIDLFCGLGGWTEGFLSEGYDVVGFDIEQHVYGAERYPAQLVIQDVLTLHGAQFKHAAVIVASSPCQAYSYMAMPWSRAKQIAAALRGRGEFPEGYAGARTIDELNALFLAPARIQREASEAAGRSIPLVQENVKGAQPWVGPAQWHYGSFYLWGDVPALMPIAQRRGVKVASMGAGWYPPDHPKHVPGLGFNTHAERATKNEGGSWFNIGSPGQLVTNKNPVHALAADGVKQSGISGARANGKGDRWFQDGAAASGSKSSARKAASARIAKIPAPLAQHIARVYRECAA